MSTKVKVLLLTGIFTLLSQIAVVSAASASAVLTYQPELPESLKE